MHSGEGLGPSHNWIFPLSCLLIFSQSHCASRCRPNLSLDGPRSTPDSSRKLYSTQSSTTGNRGSQAL
jgi:hypothetical protein